MKIVIFKDISKQNWDNFVNISDEAWLFHLYDWIQIEEREGYKNHSFMVQSKRGDPLGIFPLYSYKKYVDRFFPVKMLHTGHARSGPALMSGLGEKRRREILNFMFMYVDKISKDNKIDGLNVRLPFPFSELFKINPLVIYGLCDDFMIEKNVNLSKTEDEIYNGVEKRCRNDLRKIDKYNIKIQRAESIKEIEDYHKLHIETYNRTNAKVRPLRYFEDIWNSFYEKGYMNFFFAEKNNEKIGSIIILSYKSGATYWAGVTKTKYQDIPISTFLLWEGIMWAKRNNMKWFEVGPFFPHYPKDSKPYKIGKFKEQFGGETWKLYEGTKIYNKKRYYMIKLAEEIINDFRNKRGDIFVNDK